MSEQSEQWIIALISDTRVDIASPSSSEGRRNRERTRDRSSVSRLIESLTTRLRSKEESITPGRSARSGEQFEVKTKEREVEGLEDRRLRHLRPRTQQ